MQKKFHRHFVVIGPDGQRYHCCDNGCTWFGDVNDFAKELPQQFVECGIAEQDAVGISAGLAHSGKKVFVCGPACFYVARSLEQVKVDLAYSQNNVKILGVSGGVAYGALGLPIIACMILPCYVLSPV